MLWGEGVFSLLTFQLGHLTLGLGEVFYMLFWHFVQPPEKCINALHGSFGEKTKERTVPRRKIQVKTVLIDFLQDTRTSCFTWVLSWTIQMCGHSDTPPELLSSGKLNHSLSKEAHD